MSATLTAPVAPNRARLAAVARRRQTERLMRERVAFMLWVAAQVDDREEDAAVPAAAAAGSLGDDGDA